MQERNASLDVAKAGAIILVVMGHELQGSTPNFDGLLLFRLIYSFHMPLFMFISGLVGGFWLKTHFGVSDIGGVGLDLSIKAVRLLLPFLTWALVGYLFRYGPVLSSLPEFSQQMLLAPDNGLWFLLVLFELWFVVYVIVLVARPFRAHPLSYLIIAGLLVHFALRALPGSYGFGLAQVHFQFFYVGMLVTYVVGVNWNPKVALLSGIGFIVLVPFWQRVPPDPLFDGWPFAHSLDVAYREAVAFSGVLASAGLLLAIGRRLRGRALQAVTFVGKRTLDIYAAHFYFLGIIPPLIGPVAASLILSQVVRLSGPLALLLYGEPTRSPKPQSRPTIGAPAP